MVRCDKHTSGFVPVQVLAGSTSPSGGGAYMDNIRNNPEDACCLKGSTDLHSLIHNLLGRGHSDSCNGEWHYQRHMPQT